MKKAILLTLTVGMILGILMPAVALHASGMDVPATPCTDVFNACMERGIDSDRCWILFDICVDTFNPT